MTERVDYVRAEVSITLRDSNKNIVDIIELDVTDNMSENIGTFISDITIKRSIKSRTDNPVGVVNSSTVAINIIADDKKLVPFNKESPYYGYMNENSYIDITLIYENDGSTKRDYMGRYYTSNWVAYVTNSGIRISIDGTDILGVIFKYKLPDIDINYRHNIKEHLLDVIDSINKDLPVDDMVNYDIDDIDFGPFEWMQFNNLEMRSVSDYLNSLSQYTLHNIYIGRDNKLKVRYALDKSATNIVGKLDDCDNVYSNEVLTGNIVNYGGVYVKYNNGLLNRVDRVAGLSGQIVEAGITEIPTIELGGGVYKVNYIQITPDDLQEVDIVDIDMNKNNISITVSTEEETHCNIDVYGQTISDNISSVKRFKSEGDRTTLDVENYLLYKGDIPLYADKLVELMDFEDNLISLIGWISPSIELGDRVRVEQESIGVSGEGLVMATEYRIGAGYECIVEVVMIEDDLAGEEE